MNEKCKLVLTGEGIAGVIISALTLILLQDIILTIFVYSIAKG